MIQHPCAKPLPPRCPTTLLQIGTGQACLVVGEDAELVVLVHGLAPQSLSVVVLLHCDPDELGVDWLWRAFPQRGALPEARLHTAAFPFLLPSFILTIRTRDDAFYVISPVWVKDIQDLQG